MMMYNDEWPSVRLVFKGKTRVVHQERRRYAGVVSCFALLTQSKVATAVMKIPDKLQFMHTPLPHFVSTEDITHYHHLTGNSHTFNS